MSHTGTAVDYAHTPTAEARRHRKAAALAAAARDLHLGDADLTLGSGHRRAVRLAAGVAHASEDTWFVVHELMTRTLRED
ncbi:MAG: hypothetical protein FWF28_00845 [Micrococcales bacterium]|nr:hypothetical protein [Micrococcales bacterium]